MGSIGLRKDQREVHHSPCGRGEAGVRRRSSILGRHGFRLDKSWIAGPVCPQVQRLGRGWSAANWPQVGEDGLEESAAQVVDAGSKPAFSFFGGARRGPASDSSVRVAPNPASHSCVSSPSPRVNRRVAQFLHCDALPAPRSTTSLAVSAQRQPQASYPREVPALAGTSPRGERLRPVVLSSLGLAATCSLGSASSSTRGIVTPGALSTDPWPVAQLRQPAHLHEKRTTGAWRRHVVHRAPHPAPNLAGHGTESQPALITRRLNV